MTDLFLWGAFFLLTALHGSGLRHGFFLGSFFSGSVFLDGYRRRSKSLFFMTFGTIGRLAVFLQKHPISF